MAADFSANQARQSDFMIRADEPVCPALATTLTADAYGIIFVMEYF